jgi:two-component system chemotaxis response regulator CheY
MSKDVLIVDDSGVIRQMVKKTLKVAGLDVGEAYEASNGIEALAHLGDREVAVMLVDINMPTLNGIQLLSQIRSNERLSHKPIVIVSTEGSEKRIRELEDLGVHGYIRKPFQPEQLRDVLTPLLGVREHGTTEDSDTEDGLF